MKRYSTKEIIEMMALEVQKTSLSAFKDYDNWEKEYRDEEESFKNALPESTHENFPLNVDVVKLVYKEIFNIMPFSKSYVLQNYEQQKEGIDYLLYPAKNAKKLVIFFSGLSGRKTYNRYSWYWDEKEAWEGDTVYLFLNDLTESWYVGNDNSPLKDKYILIIQSILNEFNIDRQNTYTVGGSMGGYASILFAVDMGLKGAISVHPQVTYSAARKHRVNDWETKIRSCGSQFYDLTEFLFKREHVPFVYLEYGDYEADRDGCERLIESLQKRQAFVVFRKTANAEHVTNNPSKMTVESVLSLFESHGFDDGFIA